MTYFILLVKVEVIRVAFVCLPCHSDRCRLLSQLPVQLFSWQKLPHTGC